MTIYPTHTCFDDVIEHQLDLEQRDPITAARQLIVHGIVLHPDDAHPYTHAWVEDRDRIFQSGILDGVKVWYEIEREEFEATLKPQRAIRYTLIEARVNVAEWQDHGPWDPEFRALCRNHVRGCACAECIAIRARAIAEAMPRGPASERCAFCGDYMHDVRDCHARIR